ncbi:unnamed protein product [Ectocarpus fasciculatus]
MEQSRVQAAVYLSSPYRPGCFYYEVIECGRRVLLTGVIVFIFPNEPGQIAVTLVMACTFALLFEALAPYDSKWDSWISRSGHVIVLLSIFVAFLLEQCDTDGTSEIKICMEAFCWASTSPWFWRLLCRASLWLALQPDQLSHCYHDRSLERLLVSMSNTAAAMLTITAASAKPVLPAHTIASPSAQLLRTFLELFPGAVRVSASVHRQEGL